MKNLSEFGENSSFEYGLQNALARYARNRWPVNALKMIQAEWDLTEGRARGVVDAETTLTTLNLILRHRRGGFGFGLMLLSVMFRTSLEDFIETQQGAARAERQKAELAERHLDALAVALRAGRAGDHLSDGPSP